MKKIFIFVTAFIMLVYASCKKDNNNTPTQAMFYVTEDCGVGKIYVTLNDSLKVITGFYVGTQPCGAAASATFNLAAGTYNFSARASNNTTWNGSITVKPNSCSSYALKCTGNGNVVGNGCNSFSLNGTWVRQNDGPSPNTTGMKIYYSGSTGTITYVSPTNIQCFAAGQIKWQNFDQSSCTIDDLGSSCSSSDYGNYSINFLDINTIVLGVAITYRRQ